MEHIFEDYLKYNKVNGKIVTVNGLNLTRTNEAFELLKELYNTHCGAIEEDDNLISIHTGGWSDNEVLIDMFKDTWWWSLHHQITLIGGHYFFNTDTFKEKEWKIIKSK